MKNGVSTGESRYRSQQSSRMLARTIHFWESVTIDDIPLFVSNGQSAGDCQLPAHAHRVPVAAIIRRGGIGVNRVLVARFVITGRPGASISLRNACVEFRSL